MNPAELDSLLHQFFADGKFSGSEHQTLLEWVQKNADTEQRRAVARSRLFEAARNSIGAANAISTVNFLEDVLKVIAPMAGGSVASDGDDACFSPGDDCLNRIIHRLNTAKSTVDICVFTITDDRISQGILAAHRRGVKLRIITDNDKANDLGSDVPRFIEAKIPLKVDHSPYHMHHKFAIFDGQRLLNGSYNWTRGAAEQNEENIVDCRDRKLIAIFQNEFNALWAKLG